MAAGKYDYVLTDTTTKYITMFFKNSDYTTLESYNTDGMTIEWD
jgi:hypothetical protein